MSKIKDANVERRRNSILEMINTDGKVKVSQLAELFGISDVTIRVDLTEMEQDGLLRRVHGGALSTTKAYLNMSLHERMNVNRVEKIRIAKAVSALVTEGDTLMIDSGTTNYYVAKELANRKNLTIVTNSLQISQELAFSNMINVILLGGNLDPQYQFTFGNDTVAQLQKYRADKMIISTDGISAKHGLTTFHHQEADVSCQMIKRSNHVIAVADHSKIGKEGFAYISQLEDIDYLVTNKTPDTSIDLDSIRQKNICVKEV